jgi:UDP-N-acetylmuramate dehydrogenase
MDRSDFPARFQEELGWPLAQGVNLSAYSHFRIGGPADFLFEAATEEQLVQAVRFARGMQIKHRVIGGGYNLLFDDHGFRGLIIRNAVKHLRLEGSHQIAAASGSTLEELIQFCLDQDIGGLEFLVGIPGTLGGAVYGNAGAFDQEIGQVLEQARLLMHSDEVIRVDREFFGFSYRHSVLKGSENILLEVVLNGFARVRSDIQAILTDFRRKRENRHPPWGIACAGSFFKNPVLSSGEKVPAAFLLDQVGAKEMAEGDAAIFSGHANFIINRGNATSEQVRILAARLKSKVQERFAVDLEEEVIYLPAEP